MTDAEETRPGQEEAPDLFQACKTGDKEQVKSLLDQHADLGGTMDGLTCLELAVENDKREVVELIITYGENDDDWEYIKTCLRNPTKNPLDGTLQSTPFRRLVKKMPDMAKLVLERCRDVKDGKATFDYEFVEEFSLCSDQVDAGFTETDCIHAKGKCFFRKEKHVLEEMNDDNLLTDPTVNSLLRCKWTRYIAVLYLLNLFVYLVFLCFLMTFALTVPNPQLSMCTGGYNMSNGSSHPTCGVSLIREGVVISAAVITIIFSLIRLVMETSQLLNLPYRVVHFLKTCREANRRNVDLIEEGEEPPANPQLSQQGNETKKMECAQTFLRKVLNLIDWKYFKRESNYVEVTMYVLSIVFVGVLHRDCLCPSRGQWQAGIIAVFFAWIDLILFLNKLPTFGIYIEMLRKIIQKFLAVSIIAILLMVAFGFAFYMAFYEPDLPDTPFENPTVTFVHMVSYAIGSPDISIFRLSNDDTVVETIPYPALSYVIWITAGVVVSVLFLNLLVGLAVEDVKELKEQADVERIKRMIDLFKQVEHIVTVMRAFFKSVGGTNGVKLLDNRLATEYSISFKSVWTKAAVLWGAETHNITSRIGSKTIWKRQEEVTQCKCACHNR